MRYTTEEQKDKALIRVQISRLKKEINDFIYPSREYMCYFTQYFPIWDTQEGKIKIHSTWNGNLCNEEVMKMMERILEELKNR